jgi:hypothetical protein
MISEVSVPGWLEPLLWVWGKAEYHASGVCGGQSCLSHGGREAETEEEARDKDRHPVTHFLQSGPTFHSFYPF